MEIIRRSPEVSGAVELTDVARHIINTQFLFVEPGNRLVWQGSKDHDPNLKIFVPPEYGYRRNGRYFVSRVVLVVIDGSTDCELDIPTVGAPHIPDDPYIEDFVQAFRQYREGRSGTEIEIAKAI